MATKVYPALLVLFFFGVTIFIHELGHFLVAKRRGMKIERFSIGFGPKIWSRTRDGIDYRISWIPFGGYVALPQMMPMEAIEGKSESPAEPLPPALPSSKILVAMAGPVMNILFAILLASLVYWLGLPTPINPSVVGWVEPGSREEQLGIRAGDRVMQINEQPVKTWDEMFMTVALSREPGVRVVIERAGKRQQYLLEAEPNKVLGVKMLNLFPEGRPFAASIISDSPAARAGIEAGDKFLSVEGVPVSTGDQLRDLVGKRANLPTSVRVMRRGRIVTIAVTPEYNEKDKAGRMGVQLDDEIEYQLMRPGPTPWQQFSDTFDQIGKTIGGLIHYKQTGIGVRAISGPVGIVHGWWYQIARGGVMRGVWFAVILNVSLAVFNLLPIPVLDGGHIVFATIEAVMRKPVNPRLAHSMATVCALLLISFMLYVTFFDIQRFIPWPQKHAPKPQTNEIPAVAEPATKP